jgi:Domain of unknown function (DUF4157)
MLRRRRGAEGSAGGGSRDSVLPAKVREVLERDKGRPLDPKVREKMELRTGHDLRMVRVHEGGRAAESAREVGAAAYTVRDHVVLGAATQGLPSREGERILAHEVVHVVQQSSSPERAGVLGSSHDPSEREAEEVSSSPEGGRLRLGSTDPVPEIQRQQNAWTFSPFTPGSRSPSDVRLDWKTVQKTLEEGQAPIRRWLDANADSVKILSLEDAVGLVRRSVMEAAGMGGGEVAAAVNAWAAEKGVVLPRVSAVPGAGGGAQPSPQPPEKRSVGFSPYSMGMVGLHIDVNPTKEPDIATILRPYRDRGIAVDERVVKDVMSNYSVGVTELENLLKATGLVGGPDDVHKAAEWIAKRLLTQAVTVSAQQQQPTASETFEAENKKIIQATGVKEPSFTQTLGFGASVTVHFDFLGGR